MVVREEGVKAGDVTVAVETIWVDNRLFWQCVAGRLQDGWNDEKKEARGGGLAYVSKCM